MTQEDYDSAITKLNEIARLATEWEERAVDSERRGATTKSELGAVALIATARAFGVSSLELQRVLGGTTPVALADHHEVAPIWKLDAMIRFAKLRPAQVQRMIDAIGDLAVGSRAEWPAPILAEAVLGIVYEHLTRRKGELVIDADCGPPKRCADDKHGSDPSSRSDGGGVGKNVPAELWVITSPTMGAPTSVADVLGTEADALRVAARLNERQEDGASDWTVVPYVRRGAPPSCSEGNDG